ncbi:MAG: DUF11 domain-containing protein [Planctomycetaceae bacterium]|nr:DUF11 domain-containing protein [Planctomycetaceae bacterium]
MKSTIWKLTALAGVLGAGFLVVYQAQRNLLQRMPTANTENDDEFQLREPEEQHAKSDDDDGVAFLSRPQVQSWDQPQQQKNQTPKQPAESEPTPIDDWNAVADTSNPFLDHASASGAQSKSNTPSENSPERSRFAELMASFEKEDISNRATTSPARADESNIENQADDQTEDGFAGFAASSSSEPTLAYDPFSDVLPEQNEEPAAPEQQPAVANSAPSFPALDEVLTVSQETNPAATAPAEPAPLNFAGSGPQLAAPPVDVATAAPPAQHVEQGPTLAKAPEPKISDLATVPTSAPHSSESDDPFGVLQTSHEQAGPDSGSANPFLVLPGATGWESDSETKNAQQAPAKPQAVMPRDEPALFFPDAAATAAAPAPNPAAEAARHEITPLPERGLPTPQLPPQTVDAAPTTDLRANQGLNPFGVISPVPQSPPPPRESPRVNSGSLVRNEPTDDSRTSAAPQSVLPLAPFGQQQTPARQPVRTAAAAAPVEPQLNPSSLQGVGTVETDSPVGAQQAQITIEKQAPPDAVIGKPLIYSILVRNIGRAPAANVVVKDVTPKGSRLVGTSPQATMDETDGKLIWTLGRIAPGELRTIKVKVVPTSAGAIGSVATVSFETAVAARTVITAPQLRLTIQGPEELSLGERAPYRFTLSNTGAAEATGVYIRNIIPAGLEHPRGDDLEYDIGTLRSGESKDVELTLVAVSPGEFPNRAILAADGDVEVEAVKQVSVLASRLVIRRDGPADRFVGRAAKFTNTVTNQSREVIPEVTLVETVPTGLRFEEATDGGVFDPQRRTVTWRLRQLEPGVSRPVQLALTPVAAAEHASTVRAFDSRGHAAEVASQLRVAGFSSLKVDVAHDGAPVPVGNEVALRLTIKNRGTAPATQVRTLVEIPEEMRFVDAKGPVRYSQVSDDLIEFEVDSLGIDGEEQFDIVLTAAKKGEARVRVELQSAELSRPLNQEELVVIHPVQ